MSNNEERNRRMVFLAWRDLFKHDEIWREYSPLQLQQMVDLHYETQAVLCAFMPKVQIEAILDWTLNRGWMKNGSPARRFLEEFSASPVPPPRY